MNINDKSDLKLLKNKTEKSWCIECTMELFKWSLSAQVRDENNENSHGYMRNKFLFVGSGYCINVNGNNRFAK